MRTRLAICHRRVIGLIPVLIDLTIVGIRYVMKLMRPDRIGGPVTLAAC